jgi:hypothetical protein
MPDLDAILRLQEIDATQEGLRSAAEGTQAADV